MFERNLFNLYLKFSDVVGWIPNLFNLYLKFSDVVGWISNLFNLYLKFSDVVGWISNLFSRHICPRLQNQGKQEPRLYNKVGYYGCAQMYGKCRLLR